MVFMAVFLDPVCEQCVLIASDDIWSNHAIICHPFIVQSVVPHLQPRQVGSVALYGEKLDLKLDGPFHNGLQIDDDVDDVCEQ